MNQILDYSSMGNNGNGKHKGGNGRSSDKIVNVFAVILVIFAIFLIISGALSFLKNKKGDTESTSKSSVTKTAQATIEAIADEESETVNIIVDHTIEITKIVYKWNSNSERTIQGDGSNHLEKEIELSAGDNTLNIKVFDVKGGETSQSFSFSTEAGKDIILPSIETSIEGNKLIITATDENELAFITYRWNDEDEITVEMDEDAEDKTVIIEEIEILKGANVITISAVDTANNPTIETLNLTGVTQPEIMVNLIDNGQGSEDTLLITCKHEKGIKEIYYTLNDRPYQWTAPEGENYPEVSFTQPLDEGYNRIILEVTSVDEIKASFDGECEYTPAGSSETNDEEDSNDDATTENDDESEETE